MRLTAIKLGGFKSFVETTTLTLPHDLTAIIGPNGSGKSNIIDAVRWVMGESSAKSLRGESMTDVIFNGTNHRPPVGLAFVELIFDIDQQDENSSIAHYASNAQLAIRRQVNREGHSVFSLNGQRCRRRDINDLFLGSGLGPRSHAIIGQGTISQLVEARPEALRTLVEEAAGIARYKERRKETQDRIEHTEENLSRLADIAQELDRQLKRLEIQRNDAEQFRQLRAENRKLHSEVIVLSILRLEQDHNESQHRLAKTHVEQEKWQTQIDEHEHILKTLHLQQQKMVEEKEKIQSEFSQSDTAIAVLNQRAQQFSERLKSLSEEKLQLDQQIKQVDDQQAEQISQQQQQQQRLQALEPELLMLQTDLKNKQMSDQDQALELTQAQEAWQNFQLQKNAQITQKQHLEQQVQVLKDAHHQVIEDIQQCQQQSEHYTESAPSLSLQQNLKEKIEQNQLQLQNLNQEQEVIEGALAPLAIQIQQAQEYRDQLISKQNRWQGEYNTLQKLLAEAQSSSEVNDQSLKDRPRLFDQLEVEKPWQSAVQWVLSAWIDARIVEQITLKPSQSIQNSLIQVQAKATQTVKSNTLASVVQQLGGLTPLLEKIYLLENESELMAKLATLAEDESLITPTGIWVGQGWCRLMGNVETSSGELSLRQRIQELEQEQDEKTLQLTDCSKSLEALQQAQHTHQKQLKSVLDNRQQCLQLQQQCQMELARWQADTDNHEKNLKQIEQQHHKYEQRQLELSERLIEAEKNLANLQETRIDESYSTELRQRKEALQEAVLASRNHIEKIQQQLNELRLQQERLHFGLMRCEEIMKECAEQKVRVKQRQKVILEELTKFEDEQTQNQQRLIDQQGVQLKHQNALKMWQESYSDHFEKIRQTQEILEQAANELHRLQSEHQQQELRTQKGQWQLENAYQELSKLEMTRESVESDLPSEAKEKTYLQRLEDNKQQINQLGAINMAAIEEYAQTATRREQLQAQQDELHQALETLQSAMQKIDQQTEQLFSETFEALNERLGAIFKQIFNGGRAWLNLTDSDLLQTGVQILAQPPGKKVSSIVLLSGGEKTMTALALVLAVFQLNPAPFCLLDEVDAALDDANASRYAQLMDEMAQKVQCILITHNKIVMENVQSLIGVTMREAGVSRLVSVDLETAVQMAQSA